MKLHHFLTATLLFFDLFSSNTGDADGKTAFIMFREFFDNKLPYCMTYDSELDLYTFNGEDADHDYFFCAPKEAPKGSYKDCIFPSDIKRRDGCSKRVEPILMTANEPDTVVPDCTQKNGKIFYFGFQPCLWDINNKGARNGDIIILDSQIMYTICYDHDKEQVLRIHHQIYSPKLWKNAFLSEEYEKQYSKLTILGSDLRRQFIVPPKNMAFSVWKRPVYHYLNTKLVLKQTSDILDHFNQYIRQKAFDFLGEVRITDGSELSDMNDVNIWRKIIFSKGGKSAMVIVIHNTSHQPTDQEKLCRKSVCDEFGWKDLILEMMKPYAYCCKPEGTIAKFEYKRKKNH